MLRWRLFSCTWVLWAQGIPARHPSKAYVDTSWPTENGRNWERYKRAIPCEDCFQHVCLQKMEVEMVRGLINILNTCWILASKRNDVKTSRCAWHHSETCIFQRNNSLHPNRLIHEHDPAHQEGAVVWAVLAFDPQIIVGERLPGNLPVQICSQYWLSRKPSCKKSPSERLPLMTSSPAKPNLSALRKPRWHPFWHAAGSLCRRAYASSATLASLGHGVMPYTSMHYLLWQLRAH